MTMASNLPSPEQQEATARRFHGQRALAAPVVVQEASRCPVPPLEPQRPARGFRRAFWHWARWATLWTLLGLIGAAIGGRQVDGPHFATTGTTVPAYPTMCPLAHAATVVLAVALAVMVLFWFLVGMGAYLRLVWQTTGQAMRPIPSLPEIDHFLRAEGFDPSISDLLAMDQYLTSQRNEAALLSSALVLGPQLLARQAQGKSLL
jgi:hypothetical protein